MLKSEKLEKTITNVDKEAWCVFRDVVFEFLGNYKDTNYKKLVEKLIVNFKKLGCRITLKVNFLHSHNFFPFIVAYVNERIYQGIS